MKHEQAFPAISHHFEPGLTKREYFAGLAMQGILMKECPDEVKLVARMAVQQADALIAQLAEEKL